MTVHTMAPGPITDFHQAHLSQPASQRQASSLKLSQTQQGQLAEPIPVPVLRSLDVASLPANTVSKFSLSISPTALSSVNVPIFAYRSSKPGPTIGITCAIHGNEVNGIPVIQKIFTAISNGLGPTNSQIDDVLRIDRGTIIAVPVVNVPGFLASIRCFDDESKQDLNRLMPGKADGAAPQQYAYSVFNKIITKFDYLIDLHTASLGRRNSLYVRADMNHPVISKLALLMQPQILVHVATGGSLRGCAQAKGIHALTVEIGNASSFQTPLIRATYSGILRVLSSIGLSPPSSLPTRQYSTVICNRSFWIFSQSGGILHVHKDTAERVQPGELIAEIQSIFGDAVEKIYAPAYETVVVGVEGNPVAKGGNRVIHLGVVGEDFQIVANDGHM